MRPKRKQTFEHEQLQSYQFDFNIDEGNVMDNETTTDVAVTPLHDDLQQQDLTRDQLQQLFSRAGSALVAEATDDQEFFKRKTTIKVPKTSKVIKTPFPPPESDLQEDFDINIEQLKQLANKSTGPLIIERHSPNEQEIDHALSTIAFTFNQPMINISTLDEQINPEDLGLSLIPKIDGRWRWIDTKTVQFEAKHRLPYSTKYTLRVDKEHCVSAIGGKLDDEFFFEFSTKELQVRQFLPCETVSTLRPKCFLLFNQKIDINEIFKHICVMRGDEHKMQSHELELVDEETTKNEFKSFINEDEGNHQQYLAFTFKHDLLKATEYTIQVPEGCPSAEGPLKTRSEWSANFETYEPLKIIYWFPNKEDTYQHTATPGKSWSLTFNNSLDHSTIKKSIFKFEPEKKVLLGIEHIEYNDRKILIHNDSQPNTVYTLLIQSGILKDIHGQTLEHDHSDQPIQFHVDDLNTPLYGTLRGESDNDGTLTAWVTDLMTGAPIHQATVSILNQKKVTNQQGLCTIERCKAKIVKRRGEEEEEEDREDEILIVEKDGDLCMEVNIYPSAKADDVYVWHVFNDRGLYRPKEDVHIKGYVRLLKIEGEAKVPTYAQGIIDYTIYDSRHEELQQSKVKLSRYGTFDIKFILPDNANLGKV
ncbi:unnamed protein product [Rotaria sp. Silwood2]|nr:unnamed protein product [Rotaria sp. Silwood2]CAF4310087.1 unnamed protein product [Rotaria sp. Silwood2]